ncbi:MAG: hypothetical protein KGY80_10500 [Candidatus Thorarchaeota archaeon]|nr:hypothetical protein [Candidatus Thorarchaeota archaeon]
MGDKENQTDWDRVCPILAVVVILLIFIPYIAMAIVDYPETLTAILALVIIVLLARIIMVLTEIRNKCCKD